MKLVFITMLSFFCFSAYSAVNMESCTLTNGAASFENCINSNFDQILRNVDTEFEFEHCSSMGGSMNSSLATCVNKNFSQVREYLRTVSIWKCFTPNSLVTAGFVTCINRNFSRIAIEL